MHSRNWCPNRKQSVPADGRSGDTCPVCGLPFEDAFEQAPSPFEVPDPPATPEPDTEPQSIEEAASPSVFEDSVTIEDIVGAASAESTSSTGPAPTGWYPDPAGVPGRQRYWTGSEWTTRTRADGQSFDTSPQPSDFRWLLFSVKGRAGRAQFWTGVVLIWIAFFAIAALASILGAVGEGLLVVVAAVAYFWMGIAVSVKRWHDRGKPGVWVFIVFLPILGPFWAFIELGFLRGDDGPNPYGAPPG